MAHGTLLLRRFNGDEAYPIVSALIYVFVEQDGVDVNFEIETADAIQRTTEDTAKFPTRPSAEVTVHLDKFAIDSLVGSRFSVPSAYDERSEDRVGRLYYYEHGDLNDNVVDVLGREGDGYRVRWTGTTQDVNYYDGSKPDTRVEIEAVFRLKH